MQGMNIIYTAYIKTCKWTLTTDRSFAHMLARTNYDFIHAKWPMTYTG